MLSSSLVVRVGFSLVVTLWSVVICCGQEVDTVYGTVRGSSKVDTYGRTYEVYLGIPYAAPPVGDLRWRKPTPPDAWEGVLDATQYGAHCVHTIANLYGLIGLPTNQSEDCLFINVHVPHGVDELGDIRLPVMFFIHGGGFRYGTSTMYPGEQLALNGEVIAVSINYRVGYLGFMSTNDEASPGNYGLWDMQLALQWVHQNIEQFGGDVNSITIIGQSAGGAAASHLAISSQSNTLFHRAIAMSGVSTSFFGLGDAEEMKTITNLIGTFVGCVPGETERLVNCLREKDAEHLDLLSILLPRQVLDTRSASGPVVDGDFVLQHPRLSWQSGAARSIDFIFGHTYHDSAGWIFADLLGIGGNRNVAANETIMNHFIDRMLSSYPNPEERYQALVDRYPGLTSSEVDPRTDAMVRMTTDLGFGSMPRFEADFHFSSAEAGKATYMYQFQYRQSFLQYYDPRLNGSHIDDLYSVLGEAFMDAYRHRYLDNPDFSEEDKTVMQAVTGYYSNFAYTGNPNNGPHPVPTFWEQYDTASRPYLRESLTPANEPLDPLQEELYRFFIEDWPNYGQTDIAGAGPKVGFPGAVDITDMLWEQFMESLMESGPELLSHQGYSDVTGIVDFLGWLSELDTVDGGGIVTDWLHTHG